MVARFDNFGEGMRAGVGPAASVDVTAVSYVDTAGTVINMDATDWRVGVDGRLLAAIGARRSEEHTHEIQSLMRISYAVLCFETQTKYKRLIPHDNQEHKK